MSTQQTLQDIAFQLTGIEKKHMTKTEKNIANKLVKKGILFWENEIHCDSGGEYNESFLRF